jgi:[protein-PII] uridylyltransferase
MSTTGEHTLHSIDTAFAAHMRADDVCALMAMGSYGRGELAPWSDKDLLLVLPEAHDDDDLRARVHALEAAEWRTGVAARTTREAATMLDEDLRSWLAMLEARFLAGDAERALHLRETLRAQIRDEGKEAIERRIAAYARDRHQQYGDTVKLLEPNIKNSAGSLRDLQSMYYLALVEHVAALEMPTLDPWPPFDVLAPRLALHEGRTQALVEAWRFFLRVRATMHERVGHLHDVLDYDLQKRVAEQLGYGGTSAKESVETFMRAYYRHARNVRLAFDALFVLREPTLRHDAVIIDTRFTCIDDVLHLACQETVLDIDDIIEAFYHACVRGCTFGADLVRAVDLMLAGEARHCTARGRAAFDAILRAESSVARTLRGMNDLGVLGIVVPPFADLVSFFQHNIYHFYTADEHTLIAIERAEHLATESSLLGDLFRAMPDRSALYYAILFHDIAKPVDLPRHELIGADMVLAYLEQMHRDDIKEDVAVVVRFHLLMEQVAFRRNYHDSATHAPFARLVGSLSRLDLLLLLTYADMSALNPTVWTQWKRAVLEELYMLARGVLERRDDGDAATPLAAELQSAAVAGHAAADGYTVKEDIQIRFSDSGTHTEVVVEGHDAPYFLSRIAAVFLAADASIIAARIETRDDGTAVDIFRVVDIIDAGVLRIEQRARVAELAAAVWSGDEDTEYLFRRQRAKWKRKLRRAHNPATRIDVEFHDHVASSGMRQTIIDVYAPDSFGLLYKLSQIISMYRLTILFASIASRVDGVVDSFYVTDVEGTPFDDETERMALRSALLDEITVLTTTSTAP